MTSIAQILISICIFVLMLTILLALAKKQEAAVISFVVLIFTILLGPGLYCNTVSSKIETRTYAPDTITRTKSLIIVTKGQIVISSNDIALYGLPDSLIVIKESKKLDQYSCQISLDREISVK